MATKPVKKTAATAKSAAAKKTAAVPAAKKGCRAEESRGDEGAGEEGGGTEEGPGQERRSRTRRNHRPQVAAQAGRAGVEELKFGIESAFERRATLTCTNWKARPGRWSTV